MAKEEAPSLHVFPEVKPGSVEEKLAKVPKGVVDHKQEKPIKSSEKKKPKEQEESQSNKFSSD